ncbi:MAG: shikimate dehydrogenase [Saprospiraceae bacterium]|jgi:shikimate dehydrogenase|nr:shikimate dehydrogenase [Saprospiraceae bacterium]
MKHFGLIGFPLSHSFSPDYFENKFAKNKIHANYKSYPLEQIDEFVKLLRSLTFSGINVTIPYKEQVMPFLDKLDPVASEIGAVNTIKFINGISIGYNTDVYGFENSLLGLIETPDRISGALILGTGGASKAVMYVLKKLKIKYKIVSRNSKNNISYSDLSNDIMNDHNLIINTTPLGMYPDILSKPAIPYHLLHENNFLYDLVYNPEKTIFLSEGIIHGAKVKNGHDMLILQAERSWEIWNQPEI